MLTSFAGNVHGPVEVGHIILVSGKTIDGAMNLVINLSNGKVGEVDIPFHFSVRFHSENIIRNTLMEQAWGDEEIEDNLMASPNPIMSGWDFKVYILTGDDRFHVSVNDQPFCTYSYRMPLDTIRAIQVLGDLQKIYQVDHRRAYPSPWPFVQQDIRKGQEISFDTPRQFFPGHLMVISAIPSGNPNGTMIFKMTEGSTKRQMLHISCRVHQRLTIVNMMTESHEWRHEEQHGFPYEIDQMFKMAIGFTETAYVVAVNGERLFTYDYRFSNSFLDTLMSFRVQTSNGMQVEVQGIDHMDMGMSDCEGFETFSHPDVQIF
ncbi:CLUMA_CG006589, isoform A [Clunio marinus]|uniref:Galectin n=1 Tax=Clunio marinus TaxID=568069 RepID=A0A1J1I2A9_9DIPT|nr:CLUMA_CG006589, isoform A [Clunio marinus]